ncbi:MAG: hypothetical protein ABFD50_12530 [Smithella sp.]
MKKKTTILATVLIVGGLASSALANPEWSNGHAYGHQNRFERPHHQTYDRDSHNNWGRENQPVVVHRVPVIPPRPVMHAYEPHAAGFSMFLPGFSIQVR